MLFFYRSKFLLLAGVYDIFIKCLQYIYERGRRLAELPGGRMVVLKEGNSMPELVLKVGIVVYFLLIVPVAFVMPCSASSCFVKLQGRNFI